eukprot:SAG25_NODE_266_length_10666_cov_14.508943_11_plen_871_part_00
MLRRHDSPLPRYDGNQSLLGESLLSSSTEPPRPSPTNNNAELLPLEVAPSQGDPTCPKLSHSKLVTSWLPVFVLGSGTALALSVWPLNRTNLTWPSDAACEMPGATEASMLANEGRQVLENAVGTAPAWLRSTLLVAVGTQLLAGLCGFTSCRPLRRVAKNATACCGGGGAGAATESAEDAEADNRRLELLLSELQSESAEELSELVGRLRRRLALSELRGRSLFRMLLTGHGLNPAPRRGAGWLAIADAGSPQATWDDARLGLGLTAQQAVGVSITKLVCWHWVQPIAYLWVFSAYYCQLSHTGTISLRNVGEIVAARELLYFATTVTAAFACPVYLLADVSTVWREAETLEHKSVRLACYLLTPHNFVALSLANRFRPKEGEGRRSVNAVLQVLFYVVALAQVIADFASCFALGTLVQQCSDNGFCPAALIVGFSFTAISFFLFFGPVSVYQTYKQVREKGLKGGAAVGGILLLLGLIWIAIGGIMLASGEDIYCSWYTFSDTKCGEHGVCFSGSCECVPGFHGEYCDAVGQVGRCTPKQMRDVANGLHNQTVQHCGEICCAGFGVCSALNGGSCACVGEYTGQFCELDPCDPVEICSRHGTCTVSGSGHTCSCSSGWKGVACAQGTGCDLAPDCGHGSCVAHGGDHTCACEDGWKGVACAQCFRIGYTGVNCTQIVMPPDFHGVCFTSPYRCSCHDGWSGAACDHDPCAGADCTATKGEHKTGACVREADGLGHTCACESGYIGEHCADAFTVSGATRSDLNGLYAKTAHTCHGQPVYQRGGSGGAVLFRPSDSSYWMVSDSEQLDCEASGFLSSSAGSCTASPDGAGCAGQWHQNTDYGDCHKSDSNRWCPNPAITVVAASTGGGR